MINKIDCKAISPLLMGYMKDELKESEIEQVKNHIATCTSCKGVLKTLEMISNKPLSVQSDLWPTLKSKLSDDQDEIYFRFPPLTWQVALSLAIIIITLVAVPDSWRILAAIGLI